MVPKTNNQKIRNSGSDFFQEITERKIEIHLGAKSMKRAIALAR
jgi:hypothetical protein